jgi:hypothetical protein
LLVVLPVSTGGRLGAVVVFVVVPVLVVGAGCCCGALVVLPTRRGRVCASAEVAAKSKRERSREIAAILFISGSSCKSGGTPGAQAHRPL